MFCHESKTMMLCIVRRLETWPMEGRSCSENGLIVMLNVAQRSQGVVYGMVCVLLPLYVVCFSHRTFRLCWHVITTLLLVCSMLDVYAT